MLGLKHKREYFPLATPLYSIGGGVSSVAATFLLSGQRLLYGFFEAPFRRQKEEKPETSVFAGFFVALVSHLNTMDDWWEMNLADSFLRLS